MVSFHSVWEGGLFSSSMRRTLTTFLNQSGYSFGWRFALQESNWIKPYSLKKVVSISSTSAWFEGKNNKGLVNGLEKTHKVLMLAMFLYTYECQIFKRDDKSRTNKQINNPWQILSQAFAFDKSLYWYFIIISRFPFASNDEIVNWGPKIETVIILNAYVMKTELSQKNSYFNLNVNVFLFIIFIILFKYFWHESMFIEENTVNKKLHEC